MLAESVQGTSLHGNLLAFLSGFTFAVTLISFKRVKQPAIGAVALANLGSAIVCVLVQPSVFRLSLIPAWEWSALIYLGAIQIGLGMVCFTHGVQRISVGQAAILILVEPLLNPVWVFLVIGEIPSGYGFAGFALILAGLLTDLWLRLTFPRLRTTEPEPQQEAARVE
jgi:drug/metabolite transporter (DMT)-like permease